MKANFLGIIEATKIDRFQRGGSFRNGGGDRRLPVIRLIGNGRFQDEHHPNLMSQPESIVGWEHVQYLGEHLVCKNSATNTITCINEWFAGFETSTKVPWGRL
jgi:hypothetical protein